MFLIVAPLLLSVKWGVEIICRPRAAQLCFVGLTVTHCPYAAPPEGALFLAVVVSDFCQLRESAHVHGVLLLVASLVCWLSLDLWSGYRPVEDGAEHCRNHDDCDNCCEHFSPWW